MNMSAMMGLGVGGKPDFSAIREKMFQKADANGDSAISLEEFQKAGQNMPIGKAGDAEKSKEAFGKIDTDGNGSLSKDEMSAFGEKMSSQMQGMMVKLQEMLGGGGMGGMMGGGMGGKGGSPDISALFGKADNDKDGKISRAEFDRTSKETSLSKLLEQDEKDDPFGKIDTDGDGSLSKDEVQSFADAMTETMQQLMGGEDRQAEFMQAISAYQQGGASKNNTDLTQKLLDMLGESNQKNKADKKA